MGAIGTLLLGFCAYAGGIANSANEFLAANVMNHADDKVINELSSVSGGYGKGISLVC